MGMPKSLWGEVSAQQRTFVIGRRYEGSGWTYPLREIEKTRFDLGWATSISGGMYIDVIWPSWPIVGGASNLKAHQLIDVL